MVWVKTLRTWRDAGFMVGLVLLLPLSSAEAQTYETGPVEVSGSSASYVPEGACAPFALACATTPSTLRQLSWGVGVGSVAFTVDSHAGEFYQYGPVVVPLVDGGSVTLCGEPGWCRIPHVPDMDISATPEANASAYWQGPILPSVFAGLFSEYSGSSLCAGVQPDAADSNLAWGTCGGAWVRHCVNQRADSCSRILYHP